VPRLEQLERLRLVSLLEQRQLEQPVRRQQVLLALRRLALARPEWLAWLPGRTRALPERARERQLRSISSWSNGS
jgi:hypothetical protein